MSSYGPPGGPPPWPGGASSDPGGGRYGDPADPWGTQPTDPWGGGQPQWDDRQQQWGGQPSSTPPGYPYGAQGAGDQYGYGQAPPEHEMQPPPSPRRNRAVLLTVGLAVLLGLLGAGAATAYLLNRDSRPQAQASAAPSTPAASDPAAGPTTQAPGSAGADPRFVTTGQCVVNDGTNNKPVMRVVPCAPGTYEVLKRFDGTTDFTKNCPTVAGYQYHFYYDSSLDVLDFVLCMRKR